MWLKLQNQYKQIQIAINNWLNVHRSETRWEASKMLHMIHERLNDVTSRKEYKIPVTNIYKVSYSVSNIE